MDDQQHNPVRRNAGQGVSVGAGLQESRLNTDLIDFLRKYGSYALYAILIIAGLYAATNWYKQREAKALDTAFLALNRAAETGSADALLAVANQYAGKAAVADLANLRAAVIIFEDARFGVTPGTPINLREFPPEENRITDEQAMTQFARSEELFRSVLNRNASNKNRYLIAQQARWGLASALAAQGKFDQAKQAITDYADAAKRNNWPAHASIAANRLALLQDATHNSLLPALAELPPANIAPTNMPAPQTPGLSFGATPPQQQQTGGMPIPGFNPQGNDGASVNPVTDPEILEMLNEFRRQQQEGGNPTFPTPPSPSEPKP